MNFEEHAGKRLLAEAGITVPPAELVTTPAEAEAAARRIGACVVKAHIPAGKRGKAGGILQAAAPEEARDCAEAILAKTIAGHRVEKVLVEAQIDIARELYAAILSDPVSQGPLLLFSTAGGMDVEDMAEHHPDGMHRHPISIREGLLPADADAAAAGAGDAAASAVAEVLVKLYGAYRRLDGGACRDQSPRHHRRGLCGSRRGGHESQVNGIHGRVRRPAEGRGETEISHPQPHAE